MSSQSPSITYQHQDSLPYLPVPDLESTAHKYFRSILSLVSPQEPNSPSASDVAPTSAYNQTKACVEEFLKSPLVQELQGRLKKRAEEEGRENWLSDLYSEWSYMGYREPLIPFSSYYIAHKPDDSQQSAAKRASVLIRAILEFRNVLETLVKSVSSVKNGDSNFTSAACRADNLSFFIILDFSNQLEPDFGRSGPLCMSSYKWLFNSCRYPFKPSDTAKKFDPQGSNHLAVIRKGKFFEFPVSKPDGSWFSAAELEVWAVIFYISLEVGGMYLANFRDLAENLSLFPQAI
jgi:carnitine O-acetyltransferase